MVNSWPKTAWKRKGFQLNTAHWLAPYGLFSVAVDEIQRQQAPQTSDWTLPPLITQEENPSELSTSQPDEGNLSVEVPPLQMTLADKSQSTQHPRAISSLDNMVLLQLFQGWVGSLPISRPLAGLKILYKNGDHFFCVCETTRQSRFRGA